MERRGRGWLGESGEGESTGGKGGDEWKGWEGGTEIYMQRAIKAQENSAWIRFYLARTTLHADNS